ncbi:hypothetical protein TNCV_5103211 [Trichonephila clavipes]|nr:hypothetical protein TNCV_5103211 [Trichonephila clavipes]
MHPKGSIPEHFSNPPTLINCATNEPQRGTVLLGKPLWLGVYIRVSHNFRPCSWPSRYGDHKLAGDWLRRQNLLFGATATSQYPRVAISTEKS